MCFALTEVTGALGRALSITHLGIFPHFDSCTLQTSSEAPNALEQGAEVYMPFLLIPMQ